MNDADNPPESILPPSSPPLAPYNRPLPDSATETDNSTVNEYDSSSFLPLPPSPPPHLRVELNDESINDRERPNDDADNEDDDNDLSMPNRTAVEEKEMHRKLMDMESSFLPEPSTIEVGGATVGADDTYLVGVNAAKPATVEEHDGQNALFSPPTPPDAYKTPAPHRIAEQDSSLLEDEGAGQDENAGMDNTVNTSSLETMSSSPTAAAAARTVSQVLSKSLADRNEAEEPNQAQESAETSYAQSNSELDLEATPRRSRIQSRNFSRSRSPLKQESTKQKGEMKLSTGAPSERRRKRPKFLVSRQSSHRHSASSIATANTDNTSGNATMGVDYALKSGGAMPSTSEKLPKSQGGSKVDLSRSISLGSMASGVSGLSDDAPYERRVFSGISDPSLHTLDEEDQVAQQRPVSSGNTAKQDDGDDAVPMTPKAKASSTAFPPDTVFAQHVQDFPVPGTVSRQFRESNLSLSPDKRFGQSTPAFGRGRNMTLKEQSSTIDRLSKENFDLKMRIHFLNQALNKRSEEGVKEMISENVELKSDKLKLQKEHQSLRKTIRDLERQLKDQGANEADQDRSDTGSENEKKTMDDEELMYLRERVETYEVEIERLKTENITRESEKRKLAEMVKALGDGRGGTVSDTGAREERDMWKDMLDVEAAAREQTEDENKRLRDEILQLRGDSASEAYQPKVSRRSRIHSAVSQPESDIDANRSIGRATTSSATLVELELLKQENAELRREVSAQTSMLTSRNREKERLYQEIEELKLQRRADSGRSVGGDSIFERSASRVQARSASRASDGTRTSRMSDSERDNFETKNGELRDQVSILKLENQGLRSQLDEFDGEFESLEREYQEELDRAGEHLQHVQLERNHALREAEEREAELQELKEEAQEELDVLGEELDLKHDECQRLEVEVQNQTENLKALQAEVRSANEGIIRLEEDAQNNLQKYKFVQQELDDTNRELESMEKNLFESNNKVQRLTVQQESSQNEIAFLREEQDGDKIKIGDIESELKTTNTSLQSEKEKTKELDRRLAEERYQREVVGSKEKQEVQRIINELNREASGAKEEIRKLKKNLSSREIEASTWKERLMELENSLREALGDLNGTRSSLLMSITKLQKELESTTLELESTRNKLDEKETLLRNRDALLESHGLETRKLADLLERERQAHRADKHSFEQSLRSHQQASRTIAQNNSRISDLETARSQDRKRFSSVEQQYKDQLNERNSMFLNLWKRMSVMCGPDWAHSNSLINGNLPSQEVIGNMLFWPGFSRNLLLAVKTVENIIGGFKGRIKAVERDLTKDYHNLEHSLGLRIKKLDRMEEMVHQLRHNRRPLSSTAASAEISKLRGEVRLLKAELNLSQSHSRPRAPNSGTSPSGRWSQNANEDASGRTNSSKNPGQALTPSRSDRNTNNNNNALSRGSSNIPQPSHFSSSSTLAVNNNSPSSNTTGAMAANATSSSGGTLTGPTSTSNNRGSHHSHSSSELSQAQWLQRLRELEKRLKAEREARLLDRSGARKRLEERNAENEELKAALERERTNKLTIDSPFGGTDGASDDRRVDGENRRGGRNRSETVQRRISPRPGHIQETDGDDSSERGDILVIDHGYERSDSYDGEGDDEDDDGTGTGTDDGSGICVEVEV